MCLCSFAVAYDDKTNYSIFSGVMAMKSTSCGKSFKSTQLVIHLSCLSDRN